MTGLGLPQAGHPAEIGLSPERLERISATLRNDVERRLIPGAVMAIARGGRIGYAEAFGWRDREAGAPMTSDAIFRIASMTKPITSVAAMMLAEEGSFEIAAPVAEYLPESRSSRSASSAAGRADDDGAGPAAPHFGPDLRGFRRLAGADGLARRQFDGRGPDERRAGREARAPAADVRAGHDLGIQHVDRRAGPGGRGGVGQDAWPNSSPSGSPARSAWPTPRSSATGDKAARLAEPQADPATGTRPPMRNVARPDRWDSGGGGRFRPRPITCGSARCC